MSRSPGPLGSSDPRQLGPYRLTGRVGDGSLGTVYLGRGSGRRSTFKGLVAVRALRVELLRDRQLRAQLRHVIQTATRADSPYLAGAHGCELDSELPWLATDYVPGPSLGQLLERYGPLPEAAVRAVGGAVAQALVALHHVGVAHGDLRPNNVLLAADRPRLVDDGLGLAIGRDTGFESAADDVFDLGVLLAFAASARHPFRDSMLPDALEGPDLTGVPDRLQPIVLSCLHKTPELRPHPRSLFPALDPQRQVEAPAHEWLPESYLLEIEALEERVQRYGGRRFFGFG